MVKQLKLKQRFITLKDLLIIYLIWFFLQGFYEMTGQLVFPGSLFLTQAVHYCFFITVRLLFIPIVLYFILYRYSLPAEKIGLTLRRFWKMSKIGIKASIPLLPLILFLVHLPLVYTNSQLKPMVTATTPEEIANSLVYFILIFFITIIPALSEELLFRGLTFTFLEERWGTFKALLMNPLIYGIFFMQFNLYLALLRIVIGFFTTYLFYRSRSLIPSTIFQALFHSAFILYLFGWGWW